MAGLHPFRAVRPDPKMASLLASVPYDVVSSAEARALARANPASFLRVTRAEVDLPAGTDPHAASVYEKALQNWREFRASGALVHEESPQLYVYRLKSGSHAQTGVAGAFPVEEYDSGLILQHERTRKDKEDDRTRHIETLKAQTGPVFLACPEHPRLGATLQAATTDAPLYDFTAEDGVQHTVWRCPAPITVALVAIFSELPRLYIADGHHRAAAASRVRHAARARGAGAGEWDRFLAVAFPSRELRILPYHRAVADLNGRTADQILEALSAGFRVSANASPEPARGRFAMCLSNQWYGLEPKAPPPPPPNELVAALDVSVLQERVLGPLLGIHDPRSDQRIQFVGGSRGAPELQRLVATGKAAVAFSLHATSIGELLAVSDAGAIMPPKSTWFEPKLRDGLLIHAWDTA